MRLGSSCGLVVGMLVGSLVGSIEAGWVPEEGNAPKRLGTSSTRGLVGMLLGALGGLCAGWISKVIVYIVVVPFLYI